MENILLLSNKLFHYRVPIYNYFRKEFLKEGFEFSVLTNEVQKNFDHHFEFECIVESPNFSQYKAIIRKKKPIAVIVFMHLKDWILWPMVHWLKIQGIPVIYWNHGVNLMEPDNDWKNILYRHLHNISEAIILYSPAEKKYIKEKNHSKIFIGYNTLNFHEFPKIEESKEELRKAFNINYDKVVIYAARNDNRRKLEWLFEIFSNLDSNKYGLLIAGKKELTNDQRNVVEKSPNIKFLGEVHDQIEFNKLVKLSDVFSIPGRSGLAINQSLFWGVPYVTTNVKQSPEIWYLKDGYNGYIADKDSFEDYKSKLFQILNNDSLREEMSLNAKKSMQDEGNIIRMYEGFISAVTYVTKRRSFINS